MNYFAHSPKDGVDAQTYAAHVRGVRLLADQFARAAGAFSVKDGMLLRQLADKTSDYHDLGKLEEKNQEVLSGEVSARSLPVNHVDAGAAYWLEEPHVSPLSAYTIQAHHIGFPDYSEESNRENFIFRDSAIAAQVDEKLPAFEAIQKSLLGQSDYVGGEENIQGDPSVFMRMLLSCLADADHTNTAQHYGKYPLHEERMELRAEERLAKLDSCMAALQTSSDKNDRNTLRSQMYKTCRDAETEACICSCDSPVGSGKTTAVMAHLLKQAHQRGLRRIFVVLPFTNIIRQSVNTYRKMLVLPGEKPEDVVAELHHRADFESEDARHLTALWRAPIIVTTAVAFFETLASDTPAALRRLHELPGSAVFLDESHAALPASLMPLGWQWIRLFAEEWRCYWVLASGSLNRFWTIPEIAADQKAVLVPELADDGLRNELAKYEKNRIVYRYDPKPKNTGELADWITSFQGPRLVIMNTVQSAAVLADHLAKKFGRSSVEHLSTALTSDDRDKVLDRIKMRLKEPSDMNWTLVATSCVEAGVDLSFRVGFHEISSLSSVLQAGGRVNREGLADDAEMWIFKIAEDGMLKQNPGLQKAGAVLQDYLESGTSLSPDLTTQSISDEIALYGVGGKHQKLLQWENCQDFQRVEQNFHVIDSDTRLAVVNADVAAQLRSGKIDWKQLQKNSVQISKYKLEEMKVPRILDEIYFWNCGYNDFLGYMAGMIQQKKLINQIEIV
jgi:CRISPR-associated endonuclease/helicase Cas3